MTQGFSLRATLVRTLTVSLAVLSSTTVVAQFTSGILTNDSYWSDGKAEFDIYDAQLMRGGQLRKCELLHIFFRERIDPKTFVVVDDPKRTNAINAVRMSQIWTAPVGMFVEQGSITAHWQINSLMLLTFVGTDSFGNISKRIEKKQEPAGTIVMTGNSYREGATNRTLTIPNNGFFYEELPFRIRTIDWTTSPGEFEIQLASRLTTVETIEFKPTRIGWKPVEKSIEVTAHHPDGVDHFVIDREFPFLLREWQMADGSRLKMKRGLKADYWNYGKDGDRERALKNPMLQHPD